uniref:3-isopropylmalate dehydratase small subunit n=1 Tax=Paulinella micropora TaxID=1928728 RepID=A0A385I0K6_9EUKA|nr:3-isopropylmalate dehydratase small subunit [Paulinella micropora]AXY63452.1 3-isopropylmalate dehydratase small subunit [Paulinella micropora]
MTMVMSIPFGPISIVFGRGIILKGDDIDTDRIIPARFLRCVTFDNLGDQVFADDRIELNGDHPFDCTEYKGASILVVNSNFGCGSSREHAPQALLRWGIRAIIGESFAEIFQGNCLALGIPCLMADKETINVIQSRILLDPQSEWLLDINHQKISQEQQSWSLTIEAGTQHMFITGLWNTTAQLVSSTTELEKTVARLPYLQSFSRLN